MAALQYVDVPGYAALLLRRTYSDLALPGALMDRAHEWLDATDASWNNETHTWAFPSGASVSFGYLDHEGGEQRYRSSEFQFIGFDELTAFSEYQYRFLFTRLRRNAGIKVPLRMRSASNPGGPGHEWVKARFITGGGADRPFVPARIADNPYIDQAAYRQSLALLDPVTRAQYEDGNWDIQLEGGVARREWFPIVAAAPAGSRRVRYWDFAATERSVKSRDPDWTVGVKMTAADGVYYVEHVIRARIGPGDVETLALQTAQSDGRATAVRWEREGGASGKLFDGALLRLLAGFDCAGVPVSGDKAVRFAPFLAQARAGNVRLVAGAWVVPWLDEVCALWGGAHDDQADATAGAFTQLVATANSFSLQEY